MGPPIPVAKEIVLTSLDERDVDPDPILQFGRWFQDAVAALIPEPNSMTVATATRDGTPSARMVLLKGFDERGFVFYTNYDSRKGRELEENPRASLVFFWAQLHRQVRVEGEVSRVSAEESNTYFNSRPIGSRLGAWVSQQSQVIGSRDDLDRRLAELVEEYADREPTRPSYWGGYRVSPRSIEFWQGRPDRLHDRLRYRRENEQWRLERLSP